MVETKREKAHRKMREWREDWNKFAAEVLKAKLDKEQQAILSSVQHNPMTAVASGTARGKDFVAAVAAMCFLYLTPRFDKSGNLVGNTKVAMTAPRESGSDAARASTVMVGAPVVESMVSAGRSR